MASTFTTSNTIGTTYGGIGNGLPFNASGVVDYEQTYSATAFSGPISFNTITFFDTQIPGSAITNANYDITFSYTSSPLYSNYPISGTGTETFFDGTLGGTIAGTSFSLTGPTFNYDPALGNLLIDVQVTNQQVAGHGGLDRDAFTGVVSRAFDQNGAITSDNTGLVTQFSTTVWESLKNDTGSSNSDLITNDDTLVGSGVAGAVVHFTVDGIPIAATTTAGSNGAWTFTPPDLSDGTHTVVASEIDSTGNTRTASLAFTLDTTIPAVTAVAETPSTGNLTAGKTVTITLTTSEAVTVTGTPTLTLNDNGTATYSGISTDGKTLTFIYTVASANIDVASLQVTSIILPKGTTIQDGGGNNLNLSLSAVPTYSGPALDQDKVAEAPSLTTGGNVTVSAGGSKPLGITATPNDSDDTVSVKISNVPSFETITAPNGDVVTRNGTTYTITAPTGQPINNLMVHSSYHGKGHPQNTFNITATNLTVGETATSASKSIIVTDPPPTAPGVTPPSLDHVVALFSQSIAAGFSDQHQHGMLNTNPLSQTVTNQEQFLANPHHG
jgi:hypothetical protein